jgi:N-methylhydantoinase A
LSTLQELFDDRYEEAFGRRLSGYRARAITWRVAAQGALASTQAVPTGASDTRQTSEREVVLPGYGRCRARVERRPGLACGAKILGPALIDDTACTIAVPPSMEAAVDEMGNIVLSRQGRQWRSGTSISAHAAQESHGDMAGV